MIPLKQFGPTEITYPGFVGAVASQEYRNASRPNVSSIDHIVSEEEAEKQPFAAVEHGEAQEDTDNQILTFTPTTAPSAAEIVSAIKS